MNDLTIYLNKFLCEGHKNKSSWPLKEKEQQNRIISNFHLSRFISLSPKISTKIWKNELNKLTNFCVFLLILAYVLCSFHILIIT